MVYLSEHIKRVKDSLVEDNLGTLVYLFVHDKESLKTFNHAFSGQDQIAAKGYIGQPLTEKELAQINKPGYKGVDITSTIYKFIGATLAAPHLLQQKLAKKFSSTSLKNQFLISRCIPAYRESFKTLLKKQDIDGSWIFRVIEGTALPMPEDAQRIVKYFSQKSDPIDLIILEELEVRLISLQLPQNAINNLSPYDTVLRILKNFYNASKKIMQDRRAEHSPYLINDEYDVQDLLYVMLKGMFVGLKEEDPTPRVGAKSNKIDLIMREEGILLEVKMIKQSDNNERKFIEELKNDIQSYHQCQWLKHLIFFVYDPYGKTKDVNNFYDLNGRQTIKDSTFTIEVIINPT